MGWDEVCILCGIRQYSGLTWFWSEKGRVASETAKEIVDARLSDLPAKEIASTILRTLVIINDDQVELSADTGYNHECLCLAIGHFDSTGAYTPCKHHGRALHPTGDDVQVRRVSSSLSNGAYFTELVEFRRGERIVTSANTSCDTIWNDHDPACNVWVHVACWEYLEAWLDCRLPPRVGRGGTPLTLAGELYEVTASRHERQVQCRGWLPCIDYGGTLDAYMGTQYQDYIFGPRKGSKHIAQALREGLRDEKLVPAILRGSGFWMFVRPDMCVFAVSPLLKC